jgi:hypothetical protein
MLLKLLVVVVLLLSPCIIIKVGGLMPCWMHSHSYIKLGAWCSVEYIKLGAWCFDECLIIHTTLRAYTLISWGLDALIGYHMHSALSSWCCCRCIVVDVKFSVLSSCCQVVEIINEFLLRNYVKHKHCLMVVVYVVKFSTSLIVHYSCSWWFAVVLCW